MKKRFIIYIIIIVVILAAVFLSRQSNSTEWSRNLFAQVAEPVQNYLKMGTDWAEDTAYPQISGEVEKRGDMIKNEIEEGKEKVSQTIGEKIKDYFSGVVDSVFNPEKVQQDQQCPQCPQTCPAAEPWVQP